MQKNEKTVYISLAIVSMILLCVLSTPASAQPELPEPLTINLWLDPSDDTGTITNDNITNNGLSRIFIQVDLSSIAESYDILDPAEIDAEEEGVAVEIIVNGAAANYGTPIVGTNNSLFEYSFAPGDLSTTFIPAGGGGGLNSLVAGVIYFDGATNSERIGISAPMMLTLDSTAPSAPDPNLAPTSIFKTTDGNKMKIKQPAFIGTSEPGAIVILSANETIIGRAVADSQGQWEATASILTKREYAITARAEDSAGNVSDESEPLIIRIMKK